MYDLEAISKEKSELLFPEYVLNSRNISIEKVNSAYNIRSVNDLIFGDFPNKGDLPILPLAYEPGKIKLLRDKWFKEVWKNPEIYLNHKWQVFAQLIGFTRLTVSNPYWDPGFTTSPIEYQSDTSAINLALMKYFQLFRKYFFFRGYFWMILSMFFLYQAVKNRLKGDWEIVFFVGTSGLLFTFAYFPTTPSTEFRYLFWSAIASLITAIFGSYLYFDEKPFRRVFMSISRRIRGSKGTSKLYLRSKIFFSNEFRS